VRVRSRPVAPRLADGAIERLGDLAIVVPQIAGTRGLRRDGESPQPKGRGARRRVRILDSQSAVI
jgi:hypothetical protein